jgi:hypothetical protein
VQSGFSQADKSPDLWETFFMIKNPKVGDAVFNGDDRGIAYLVTDVDYDAKTADINTTGGAVVVHHNIAWSELTLLDESENAARIVREASE